MKFYKYQGAGNDFVLIDNFNGDIQEDKKSKLAIKLCDRRFGVGGDGLIFIESSKKADVKMRIFNPDGSEPRMCGNGIRCLAKYVYDNGIVKKKEISIETLAGMKKVWVTVEKDRVKYVRVDVGKPEFDRGKIPAMGTGALINKVMDIEGKEYRISAVKVGVPHVVIFVDGVDNIEVKKIGRIIRFHKSFPEGTNVNFAEMIGENILKVRTYERGVEDETLACGTGIGACGAISSILGKVDASQPIEINAKGGAIYVRVERGEEEIKRVYVDGPVEFVFEGEVEIRQWED